MTPEETDTGRFRSRYVFDCDSEPIPPGTKCRQRLPRESEPLPRRVWWLVGAVAIAALIVGIAVGRYLLL